MKKMKFILAALGVILAGAFYQLNNGSSAQAKEVTVYHSPTCGCCKKWISHLERSGFVTKSVVVDDVTPIKDKFNVPRNLSSCHTAVVDGYVIEGHVPASAIKKLLTEKPTDFEGIAVPGMPMGSPGMEGHYQEKYDVLSFGRNAPVSTFLHF